MNHGTARHGTARHGTARHGTARHGTARHGTARHGTNFLTCSYKSTRNFLKRIIITFLITIVSINMILSSRSYAENKKRVAIIDFNADNRSKAYANTVRNLFEVLLHKTGCVEIVERKQMEAILKEQGFQMTGCTDTSCAVEIGKLLSADLIAMGSISKMGAAYRVTVKFVSVEKGSIKFAESVKARTEDDIDESLKNLSQIISGKICPEKSAKRISFNISVSGIYIYPFGEYGDIAEHGYGGSLNLSVQNILFKNSVFMFTSGFYSFTVKSPETESIWMLPFSLNVGYSFTLIRWLSIVPVIGAGCMMSIVSFDKNGIDPLLFSYSYSMHYYFNPMASVRVMLDFTIIDSVHLFVAPVYTIFVEKSRFNHLVGGEAGVTIRI